MESNIKKSCYLLLYFLHLALSQTFNTIPSSESQPIYVLGQKAGNVSIYCAVYTPGLVITTWQYKRAVDVDFETIFFNGNDEIIEPVLLQDKIEVDGPQFGSTNATYRNNVTILNFTSEDNFVTFRCGSPNGANRKFTIGLPGNN